MSTQVTIPDLDKKGLRQFGLMTGGIVAVLFGLFFPWLLEFDYPLWPWIIFAVLGVWAIIAPRSLNPVYRIWMRFGLLISKVTTPIIMGLVFFVVIMPFGLAMRILGKDPMRRQTDESASSYRVKSEKPDPNSLESPF